MKPTRRDLLQLVGVPALVATMTGSGVAAGEGGGEAGRRFRFAQIDVFAHTRLQGNPLIVFLDARAMTDTGMHDLARETNLQETTFILPREREVERRQGVKVRIFTPRGEIPFGGHPTLGTAMVIRNRLVLQGQAAAAVREIILDLKVGRIPVTFSTDASGHVFGEMHQVDPVFGRIHDRATVAAIAGIEADDISEDAPIQTVSTGLPFAIVPLKKLETLQALSPDGRRTLEYFGHEAEPTPAFYYVTRDTRDPAVGLRARGLYPEGEDPATGSAAGCTAAWMVRYGIAKTNQTVRIEQGVEISRPSQIFVHAERQGEKVSNVRVGGNGAEVAEGLFTL